MSNNRCAGVLFCVPTLTVLQYKFMVVHVVTFVLRTVSALIVNVKASLSNYLYIIHAIVLTVP